MEKRPNLNFWQVTWKQFTKHPLGYWSLVCPSSCLMAIFAPFLASSKALMVRYDGEFYFPLFRYLFFKGFYTKNLDQFYNLLIYTFPLFIIFALALKHYPGQRKIALWSVFGLQVIIFAYLLASPQKDPASNPALNRAKELAIRDYQKAAVLNPLLANPLLISWDQELNYMNSYAKLNMIVRYQLRKEQQERLQKYTKAYLSDPTLRGRTDVYLPTLWEQERHNEMQAIEREKEVLKKYEHAYPHAKATIAAIEKSCQHHPLSKFLPSWITCEFLATLPKDDMTALLKDKRIVNAYENAQAQLKFIHDRHQWLEEQSQQLSFELLPFVRHFHWEDDAGGDQTLNRYVSWWDLTRTNRKDMVAALIFGVRISLSVGLLAISLALLIGIPIGAVSGYYGGRIDIITYRLIEIWESMPTFFMLLMVVAFLQSKSIFLVIAVIGLFGWTGFSRFVRGEVFRQKQLPYVEACHALGYNDSRIMFSHLLPNAIPPLLTLVPFAIMGAITSEAGLSFLGLGEEGSCSWGVLMDEGRTAFPSESYLLWPPAILLTILLVSIALVGDALRDSLDPKLHRS